MTSAITKLIFFQYKEAKSKCQYNWYIKYVCLVVSKWLVTLTT